MGAKPVIEISIAVWVEGEKPALVMVHGSIADHATFEPFVAVLRHRQPVHRIVSTPHRSARADAR